MRFPFLAGHTAVLSAVCILLCLAPTGCGGKSATECRVLSINVGPGAATVNHAAAPPGNTQQFLAFVASEPSVRLLFCAEQPDYSRMVCF